MTRLILLLTVLLACLTPFLTAGPAQAEPPTQGAVATAPNLFGTIDTTTLVGTVDLYDASGSVVGTIDFAIDPSTLVLTGTADIQGSGFTVHARGRQSRPGKFYGYAIYLSPFHTYYFEGKWDAAGNVVGGWM